MQTLEKWREQTKENFWTLCYELNEPSNILKEAFWYNTSLEYVSIYEILHGDNYYYFYFNTRRYALLGDYKDLKQVGINEIYNLIPCGSDVRNVKYTSTSNASKGARTRDISGYSLEGIPANLFEKLSYCRNAIGKIYNNKNIVERYIGTLTAKVSERETCTYNEYISWCKNILIAMFQDKRSTFFNRFSYKVEPPTAPATSIMLEFGMNVEINGDKYFLDSQFCEITNDIFNFTFNSIEIQGNLYKDLNNKIHLNLNMNNNTIIIDSDNKEEITDYLHNKNFTIYYATQQIIYTKGYYFMPNIKTRYNEVNNYELWDNIETLKELKDCKNEKLGEYPQKAFINSIKWPIDSVFGVILKELENHHKEIDYLVCDDMGCEFADFIALSSQENKVIMIHCKHKKTSISASSFQDVCGQANKNIHILFVSDYLTNSVTKSAKWNNKWVYSTYKTDRMIKGSVETFLDAYTKIMQKPNSRKEVWLVNSGLSKSELEKQLTLSNKKKQKEQTPPLLYILASTQDNLTKVNAKLKIYCKE